MSNSVQVPQKQREKLLTAFPCFAALTLQQAHELASLMEEVTIFSKATIVNEGELVDSFYIIVSGEAEVTHAVQKRKTVTQVPIAVLHFGESIGLNDTGFYSSTGKRTATVSALTPMLLLKVELKTLNSFLEHHHLESSMYAASQQMLRVHFIKQSLPFSKLSHERLLWLADRVEEKKIPSGQIIFEQGEPGDRCYLIQKGEVEIFAKDDNCNERRLAVLKPPTLFGEATLITHEPRNASARALSATDLLMLKHEHLSELIESEANVAYMFMNLMVDRSRPLKNPQVGMHTRTTADGQELTILKNPQNGTYFKLSKEGAFIWDQLDGKHTLQDITLNLAQELNVFAPNVVAALISKLTQSGLISNLEPHEDTRLRDKPFWLRAMSHLRRLLEVRKAIGDVDPWLSKTYNRFGRYFFSYPAQIVLALLASIGFIAFVLSTPFIIEYFSVKHISLLLVLALIPFSLLAAVLHELGHAFAVKSFGREVHYIGIGWQWLRPIAFTDTSDMWLATRKPRMITNLAGVYVDVLIAGIAALLIWCVRYPYVQGLLWLFALYTYIGGLRMLSPIQEMDGYYVLMDWVEKNRLRHSAVVWLIKKFPRSLRQPHLFKENWPEVSYWIACLVYLVLVTFIIWLVQSFVFKILDIQTKLYVSLIIPFLVLIFSSLTIIADIRSPTERE